MSSFLSFLCKGIHSEAVTSSRKCGGCQPSGTGSVVAAWLFATCHTWTETWKMERQKVNTFKRSWDATFNTFHAFQLDACLDGAIGQESSGDRACSCGVLVDLQILWNTFPQAFQLKLQSSGSARAAQRSALWRRCLVHFLGFSVASEMEGRTQLVTASFPWNHPKKISFSPSLGHNLILSLVCRLLCCCVLPFPIGFL